MPQKTHWGSSSEWKWPLFRGGKGRGKRWRKGTLLHITSSKAKEGSNESFVLDSWEWMNQSPRPEGFTMFTSPGLGPIFFIHSL